MHLTRHAEERIQHQHISEQQLDWLLSYGRVGHHKGVCLYLFDRDGFEQLLREIEPTSQTTALKCRHIYAVVANGAVVTVGHRDDRLKPQKPHRRIRRGVPSHPATRRIHHRTH